jgi:hypothetical protein
MRRALKQRGRWVFIRVFSAFAFPLLAWLPGITPAGASSDLKEGHAFPTLVLPSLDDGAALSIADFRGRKLALHVFASW